MSEYASDVGAVTENLQAAIGRLPIESVMAAYAHADSAANLVREAAAGDPATNRNLFPILNLLDDVRTCTFRTGPELQNARTELASYAFTISGNKSELPPAMILPYETTTDTKEPDELAEHQRRALAVRDLIDPEHTLPTITLARTPPVTDDQARRQDWYIVHNGKTVGACSVVQNHDRKTYHFRSITLYHQLGQGLGTATYLAVITDALRAGYTFQNDPHSQTEQAKKIWEKLTALGVAREVTPFYKVQFGKYQGYYIVDGKNHKNGPSGTGQIAA